MLATNSKIDIPTPAAIRSSVLIVMFDAPFRSNQYVDSENAYGDHELTHGRIFGFERFNRTSRSPVNNLSRFGGAPLACMSTPRSRRRTCPRVHQEPSNGETGVL